MKTFTKKQRKEFEKVVEPVMKYLSNPNLFHPNVKIVITRECAELVEGIASTGSQRGEVKE